MSFLGAMVEEKSQQGQRKEMENEPQNVGSKGEEISKQDVLEGMGQGIAEEEEGGSQE